MWFYAHLTRCNFVPSYVQNCSHTLRTNLHPAKHNFAHSQLQFQAISRNFLSEYLVTILSPHQKTIQRYKIRAPRCSNKNEIQHTLIKAGKEWVGTPTVVSNTPCTGGKYSQENPIFLHNQTEFQNKISKTNHISVCVFIIILHSSTCFVL